MHVRIEVQDVAIVLNDDAIPNDSPETRQSGSQRVNSHEKRADSKGKERSAAAGSAPGAEVQAPA